MTLDEFDALLNVPHDEYVRQLKRERFEFLREFYAPVTPKAMALPSWEWAVDINCVDWRPMFSPIEAALWSDIRDEGAVLYPQYPIGPFFSDFANPKAGLVIECDGAAFHKDKERDARRDEFMFEHGFVVVRLTGKECMTDLCEYDDPETGAPRIERGFARSFIREAAKQFQLARRFK
jgi:very-short-patch-repair endonuclease